MDDLLAVYALWLGGALWPRRVCVPEVRVIACAEGEDMSFWCYRCVRCGWDGLFPADGCVCPNCGSLHLVKVRVWPYGTGGVTCIG